MTTHTPPSRLARAVTLLSRHKLMAMLLGLLVLGVTHRAMLLMSLWPTLSGSIMTIAAPFDPAYLLNREVLQRAPWAGLLYLQMTPPLPNLVYALLVQIHDPFVRFASLVALQGLLSTSTSMLLAVLLARLRMPYIIATLAGVVFLLWGDLIFIEYIGFGFTFHESLTMLFCIATCHVAIDVLRRRTSMSAFALGTCIALLALTRASFSYFFLVAPLWFVAAGLWQQRKLLPALMLPIILLQGGWAVKNLALHGYFSVSTSTWGGANLLHGELARGGFDFYKWLETQQNLCDEPWLQMTRNPAAFFHFILDMQHAKDVPAAIAEADQRVADLRGAYINKDTRAAREFSSCLQREFVQFWRQNPRHALQQWWRSYQNFWLPIRHFAMATHLPVSVKITRYDEGLHLLRRISDSFEEPEQPFLMLKPNIDPYPMFFDASQYLPIRFLDLPILGSLTSAICAILFHIVLVVVALRLLRGKPLVDAELTLPLMLIVYVAVLTSIVEYPENMRFRLAVEPLLWVLGMVMLQRWALAFRRDRVASRNPARKQLSG